MAACLLLTCPLEFVFTARVYRRPRALIWAVCPVALAFSIWDVIAIRRGNWHYNPEFVTGLTIPGPLPIEELVFFLVIPICGLLTYESVGTVLRRLRYTRNTSRNSGSGASGDDPAQRTLRDRRATGDHA